MPKYKKIKTLYTSSLVAKMYVYSSLALIIMKCLYVYNMSHQYIAVYMVWQISVCHEIPEVLRHIVMTGELSFIQKDVVTLLYIMH